jgi:hypothetical protein
MGRLLMSDVPASVQAMYRDDHAPTADFNEFVAAYNEDDNWWWRVGCGHHMNLFDEAIERIDLARAAHRPAQHARLCGTCMVPLPCPTLIALDGLYP